MDLILDTHTLIWFMNGDQKLPDKSIKRIRKY
jgi:PIN domain nuclease of toxin-antitoxin system